MTLNASIEGNKTNYHLTLKEKESSTENSPLAALQGKFTLELDITLKTQIRLLNSLKTKKKTLGTS